MHFQPDGGIAVLSVTNNMTIDLGYFTEVGFGTPAQRRQILLDTSSLNTFIFSVECDSCPADTADGKGYNASDSSTHKNKGTSVAIDHGGLGLKSLLVPSQQRIDQPCSSRSLANANGHREIKDRITPNKVPHWDLHNYTALFTTALPYIYLRDDTAVGLMELLGFDFDKFLLPPNVACDDRVYMPNVYLTIAGHTFTLSPYDYTIEWSFPGSPTIFVSAFSLTGLDENYDPQQIILGSVFLRKYYSIHDYNLEAIGFTSLM
ncbi:hypothetical protein PISL3812_02107 [Talaromyces islandicus]|uniref:Peptidase A1 domain-containing protein n=1 Tax=Talaromyces islandicus TaxID=28573 RepID=A0A0U1LQR4_TALIS|nr:hypothetical protein PISL3812_02107 [Talaromyces islandicus]